MREKIWSYQIEPYLLGVNIDGDAGIGRVSGADVDNRQLDYFGGLRWWNIEVDVVIDPAVLPGTASRSVEEDWIDGFIGARWKNPIGEKWLFSLRGDVGAGAADFTWKVATGFRYRIGDSTALDLAYIALGVDYEDGNPGEPGYFMYDTITHGPAVGFQFQF
jgi:hypothetical protein